MAKLRADVYFYVYEDHLYGGYFVTNEELSYDELYCDQCGDSDRLVASGYLFELESDAKERIEILRAVRKELDWGKKK